MDETQIREELRKAIVLEDFEKAMELIGSDTILRETTTAFGTCLHVAAASGRLDIVKRLVALGADVNQKGEWGEDAVNEAATEGHFEVVQYLLSRGAKMDVSDPRVNPLFGAIMGGHTRVAKLLIDNGIDTRIKYTGKRMKGMDAITFAHERGQAEIVEYLRSLGIPESWRITSDATPGRWTPDQDHWLAHITQHFGVPEAMVFQEVLPCDPSVAIYVVKCDSCIALITKGMSDKPLVVSAQRTEYRFAELVMLLPRDWSLDAETLGSASFGWPIEWLRRVAMHPHLSRNGLDEYAIFKNGDPPVPFAANTKLSCLLAIRSPNDYGTLYISRTKQIVFYDIIALYSEEHDLVTKEGVQALLERFAVWNVNRIVDLARVNVAV